MATGLRYDGVGFCIDCGSKIENKRAFFCYNCLNNPDHRSMHEIIYQLRKELVAIEESYSENDEIKRLRNIIIEYQDCWSTFCTVNEPLFKGLKELGKK